MQKVVSNSFSISANKEVVSFDHNDIYSLIEASGNMPSVDDARWRYIPLGGQALKPTASAPYLWHKTITFLTDGSHLDPVISFGGSLGQNGVDYDLVPSVSSILKRDDETLTPDSVSCSIIRRNADGSAENLPSIPAGYSIRAYRDGVPSSYSLGQQIATSNLSLLSFELLFNNVAVERHDIRVVVEGSQGIDGRGIQSQDYRFKATNSDSAPEAPTSDAMWNTWFSLSDANYSENLPYLWKCIKTVYVDGNGVVDVEYHVEGPTVWGQSGTSPFVVDIDNEMTSIPVAYETGIVETNIVKDFNWKGFYGLADVSDECLITANPNNDWPAGFSCDPSVKTNPKITIAQGSIPPPVAELEFKISHSDYGDRFVRFSVATSQPGSKGADAVIYELLPSLSEISVARTESNGYSPDPLNYAITCGYVKHIGSTLSDSVNDMTDNIDGYYIYFRLQRRNNNTWTSYFRYDQYKNQYLAKNHFSVSTYNKIEFILCRNTSTSFASESSITSLADRETIPVVSDGVNGLNGTSPYLVDLDNEMGAIACDASGHVINNTTFNLRISAWNGASDVTSELNIASINKEHHAISYIDTITDDHRLVVTVPSGIILSDVTKVEILIKHPTYEPEGRTLIFYISPVCAGEQGSPAILREILTNISHISFSRIPGTNNLTPDVRTLTVTIRHTEGNTVSEKSLADANVTVCWDLDSMPQSKSSGKNISTTACSISKTTTASCVCLAAFDKTSGRLLDKETIPIIKDGELGKPGQNGSDGNGTDSVTLARMFTMGFEAPSNTDYGWIEETSVNYPSESELSETNRYLWQRKKTTYTQTSEVTYEVSLINQFQSGVRANLLEDTAFREDNEMEAWETHVGSVVPAPSVNLPQNAWKNTPEPQNGYTDILVQKVLDGSNLKKIQPNKWYTLSFYAAQDPELVLFSGSEFNGSNGDYTKIANAIRSFYLTTGQQATVNVTGYLRNPSAAYMGVLVWTAENGTIKQSEYGEIRSGSSTTLSVNIRNNQSSGCVFNVCVYLYDSNRNEVRTSSLDLRGYCTKISVNRGRSLTTYINRTSWTNDAVYHGAGAVMYVDGIKITRQTTLPDGTEVKFDGSGTIIWQLSATPTRHYVTFKTANWNAISDAITVRFRHGSFSHSGLVSMPKLEENTIATEWIESSSDRYAENFQHVYVGEWKASTQYDRNTYYLYALGVRHVVRAQKSASENTLSYFRLKKRTTNEGLCSTIQPYADSTNWEEAGYLRFVAADLLLAEDVITDKLTVSKIRSKNDTFVIDENGNVSANGGNFSNVKISSGVNNGARVEILPKTSYSGGGKMAIYDSDNNIVAQYSGEKIDNPVDLYGSSQDNRSIQISNKYLRVENYDCDTFMWKYNSATQTFSLPKQMILSFQGTTVYVETTPADSVVDPKEPCLWRVTLSLNGQIVYTYNGVAERGGMRSFELNIPPLSAIGKQGDNVFTFELALYDKDFSDNNGSYAEASAYLSAFIISASIEKQMSYHFANGLAIGMSSNQYFISYGTPDGMVHEMRSGVSGLRIHPAHGIQKWNGSQWVTANL